MKTGDSPTTEKLREALIKSVEIARAGQKEKPPVDPPARLKQFLAFRKFPERALNQVREVVETDEEFRERVVAAIKEEDVSRVGWLWLVRPEGWEQECQELATVAEQESEQAAGAQSLLALEQKLQRADGVLEKVERQREKADKDRDAAKSEVIQARTEARQASEMAGRLTADLAQLRTKGKAAQKNMERLLRKEARNEAKLKSSQTRIDRLEKELRDSREQHSVEVSSLKERLAAAEDEVAMARAAGFKPPEPEGPEQADEPEPLTKRTPVPMPGGLLNDTPEAAEHLLRTPKVVMLVDGYNVTFKNWQEMSVRDQRVRLLQRLDELSARYSGPDIVVVFDGTETDYDYIPTTPRSLGVTVRFSPSGVEADDVIIEKCREYPLWQPLVVVSHDSQVREGARKLGANLVQPSKLLMLMGVQMENEDDLFGFMDR